MPILCGALVLMLLLPACGIRAKGAGALEGADAGGGSGSGGGVFEAVALSVHPLTRLMVDADGTGRADVHFEVFDRFGHPVKSLGEAAVELVSIPAASVGGAGGRQIGLWGADLRTPTVNADAYDPVTRTYRLKISGISQAAWGSASMLVRVRFVTGDGQTTGRTLQGELAVEVPTR
ncbi:MAG: hypothetical protein ACTS3F_01105 [Phycisphaerales bacterium]